MTLSKHTYFWPLICGLIIVSSLFISLIFVESMVENALPVVLISSLLILLVSLHLINRYVQYQRLLRDIATLTTQFSGINQGHNNTLNIKSGDSSLTELVSQLQAHLALETERLVQEQNFSADASHELRTPLAGMRLQAQVAQRTSDAQQRDKALNNIMLAIDRSTRLIEQLLVFSRLTRRRNIAENSSEDLLALFHKQLLKHAQWVKSKSLTIVTNLESVNLPKITIHRDQFTAMLENLIINSLSHCPEAGQVRFMVETQNQKLRLTFEDSGNGIDSKELAKVLIPFQKSSDGKQKSTGLGLAIADRVATLHGGQLSLGDSPLGGLKVTVELQLTHE